MVFQQCISSSRRRIVRNALLAAGLTLMACAAQAAPRVVVSIAPVHALVAAVMEGVGSPQLLIPAGTSPHSYALRPSQRRVMGSAQLLIWVGANLEPFLLKPITELASSVPVIELMAEDTVRRSTMRADEVFASRSDGNESHAEHPFADAGSLGHAEGDPHVWLDPDNAIAIVSLVTHALVTQDPSSATRYTRNARQMIERIQVLDRQIDTLLSSVRDVPYVVFHDAYQGFENHFRVRPVAAIAVSPTKMPGTRHVLAIRRQLRDAGVRCVFSEPQYQTRLVDALTDGLDVRRGVLDPLGREPAQGVNGWIELMQQLATNLHACLSAP